jgi:hypothetical protein
MRIEMLRSFMKHPSTLEKYMVNLNQNWMVFRDRQERLCEAVMQVKEDPKAT